jgi:transposase
VSKIALYKVFNYIVYRLYTGCQWTALPIGQDTNDPTQPESSWDAVYYPYRQWSLDESLEQVWPHNIPTIREDLGRSVLSLHGSHALGNKGGEAVAYQKHRRGRKRLFNLAVSKDRFASERTIAWIDQLLALLVRFDLKNIYFMGSHFLACTSIKLRNVLV